MQINKDLGEFNPYDNLIASDRFVTEVKTVRVKSNQGVIKKGTVLQSKSEDKDEVTGQLILSILDGEGTADCIAVDDYRTDVQEDSFSTVVITAYETGHFNRLALIVKEGYEISPQDETSLRYGGIILSNSVSREGGE